MPYRGETYRIPYLKGGWNTNPNTDLLPPETMIEALNINLHRGGRETRGGVVKVNGTPITDSPQIMGAYQFRKKNGNTFIITYTSTGKIIKDYTTELKTGLTINVYPSFEVFDDKLYMFNGADRPQVWDGVAGSTSDLANVPTAWTNNWPKYVINHGKGVSRRLWTWGCPNNLESIYISANGTDNFSDTSVLILKIETNDGFGIVGGVEYGDRLIMFGKRKPFIIDDSSSNIMDWGYQAGQWEGGVAHHRLIVKTPTDIIAMAEDGEIYSVLATQSYGDYVAVSLTRPPFLHHWIKNNIDLSQIDKFHVAYDYELRAIKIFMVRKGQTKADAALTMFVDRGPTDGWVKHQYAKTDFGSCSAVVKKATGDWKIYVGGYSGYVYELEDSNSNDDNEYFYNGFITPYLTFDAPRIKKRYDRGWLVIKPQGTEIIKVNAFVDGVLLTGGFLLIDNNGDYISDENLNIIMCPGEINWLIQATPSDDLMNLSHPFGLIGTRLRLEIYNNTINEKMFIVQSLIDFTSLGAYTE